MRPFNLLNWALGKQRLWEIEQRHLETIRHLNSELSAEKERSANDCTKFDSRMQMAETKIAELEAQRDLLSAENRRLEFENAGISAQVCDVIHGVHGVHGGQGLGFANFTSALRSRMENDPPRNVVLILITTGKATRAPEAAAGVV